jgi:hypothetical protein
MRPARFVSLCIVDTYAGNQGLLEARLFGSVRVARAFGPLVSQGELMRYLAELPWVAPAMLHNRELSWRELSPTTVEVSATSVAGPVRLRLSFANGDIVGVEADDRPRAIRRHFVPTRWVARYTSYREFDGWRIPTRAEVSWIPKEGGFACWRGQVTDYMAV